MAKTVFLSKCMAWKRLKFATAKRVSLSQLCYHTKGSSLLNNFIPKPWNCGCLTIRFMETKVWISTSITTFWLPALFSLGHISTCIPFACCPVLHLLRPYVLVWDPSLGSIWVQVITALLASVFQLAQLQFQFCHICSVAKQEETLNYFKCCMYCCC